MKGFPSSTNVADGGYGVAVGVASGFPWSYNQFADQLGQRSRVRNFAVLKRDMLDGWRFGLRRTKSAASAVTL